MLSHAVSDYVARPPPTMVNWSANLASQGSPGTISAACGRSAGGRVKPHLTDVPILNYAGAATYPRGRIAEWLASERITSEQPVTARPLDRADIAPIPTRMTAIDSHALAFLLHREQPSIR